MNYTDKQLEDLINNVYAGIITPKNLPLDLYNVTLDRLTAAIVKGFGTDFAEDSADALLFEYYKHNIAIFSGAKTFQQVKDMTNLVMTSNGVKRDFSEFKKIIKGDQFHDGLFKTYNENYLKTEFNTAFATAQMGREWNEFASEAEIFPYLKYVTVKDERVRHNHKPFDGVVRPVGDSFWDSHMPPNGFNCRCYVLQLEEGEETTDTQIKNMPEVDSPLFAFNPGKSGRIFDESIHPYTKNIEERYKVDAAKNWGLPTPPKPTKKIKTPTIAAPVVKNPNIPENIDEIFDEKIDIKDEFWNLLKSPMRIKKGSSSFNQGNNVVIDTTGRFSTEYGKKKIFYHEFGHAIHDQQRWIRMPFMPREKVFANPIAEKTFTKWVKIFKTKDPKLINGLTAHREYLFDLRMKYSSLNSKDLDESIGAAMDVIASLTKGIQGWGHAVNYWKGGGGYFQYAEFFAHAFENKYIGNEVLKGEFPELYDDMILMLNELIDEAK